MNFTTDINRYSLADVLFFDIMITVILMKKILISFIIILSAISLSACVAEPNPDYCVEGSVKGVYKCTKTWSSMFDTTVSLTFYLAPKERYDVERVFTDVESILLKYHQYFDKYNEYPGVNNVYTINQNNQGETVVDQELFNALSYVLTNERSVKVGNTAMFNIALNPVLKVWHDARENPLCTSSLGTDTCPVPTGEMLSQSFNIYPEDIVLNSETLSVSFAKPNMSIDLGGFGKGYASEVVTDYLDSLGYSYILNAGNSNVKAGGINPNNNDGFYYIVLLEPTFEPFGSSYYVTLKVPEDMAIVTSGNYQRYFIGASDGLYYNHIIDPRTYLPGGDLENPTAVTVLYEDGGMADIYSTAIYLLGYEDGLAYVESVDGLEAIWYLPDGSVSYSSGFNQYLYQLNQ